MRHPVRIAVATKPGFGKAVKLAASLQFGVRLKVGQEDAGQIGALARVLEAYLHKRVFAQPVKLMAPSVLTVPFSASATATSNGPGALAALTLATRGIDGAGVSSQ
ncbi:MULTISPECIES: hypothetical protein [Thiorhodovibrio]|uniref:hypothetical protein n=1 Tax=Thiorhodovibrio TaxID=61593 RepID=UPI001913DD43|nr:MULTISPECIES: hypothetical protein [Thiorhodovibrio]MBK5970345.1 hypothetical protein [Thiorhodovibrio winogradskyi]WPL13701.1 hypothetical protein Thiosp_03517 [Thiorhodovibrio litoralis]